MEIDTITVLLAGAGAVATGVAWAYKTFVSYKIFDTYTTQVNKNHERLVDIITEAMDRQ